MKIVTFTAIMFGMRVEKKRATIRETEMVDVSGVPISERLGMKYESVQATRTRRELLGRIDAAGIEITQELRDKIGPDVAKANDTVVTVEASPVLSSKPVKSRVATVGGPVATVAITFRAPYDIVARLQTMSFEQRWTQQNLIVAALDAFVSQAGF